MRKKRYLSLFVCACLMLALMPAAFAAGTGGLADNEFPSFGSALGYCLEGSDEGTGGYYEPGKQAPMGHDELLQCAQEYVDLVLEHCPFTLIENKGQDKEVVSWSDGSSTSYRLRYTGTAEMASNMTGDYFEQRDYYPYHLKLVVWESEGKCWISLAWDDELEAVETDLRTPTGERLGRERPSLTVVLALGYPKMTVGNEVLPVDSLSDQVCPIAEEGRTLVPASRIVDAFGGESGWDGPSQSATFTLGERRAVVPLGSRTITVNGKPQTIETPAKAAHNRTYVPLRAVLEGLGLWVGYEPAYKLVIVSTDDLSGEKDLVGLEESQRLFASEAVPEVPRHTKESYTLEGGHYTMEVGEALSLYNAYKATATHYAYTWEVTDGGELVHLDPNGPSCRFYAKRPGTVTLKARLDETWEFGLGSFRNDSRTVTMTITISAATSQGSGGGLMKWQTCPACGGAGTIRSGTRQIECPTCLGQKQVLLP